MGLGTAQAVAPRTVCRIVGASDKGLAPKLMRLMGLRELAQGTGILVRPRPKGWLWSRVAGDALDLSLLGLIAARNRKARTAFAIANVIAVAIPDVYESRFLSRKNGPVRSAMPMRKAVTINRSREVVQSAWAAETELQQKIREHGATARLEDAPGDRGTEVIVDFVFDPPAGDIGAAALKLLGKDLATQLSDDLRLFKQRVETGQVVRSDATLGGHQLAEHLRQRAAQPAEEIVR
jgi:hypothetical protein